MFALYLGISYFVASSLNLKGYFEFVRVPKKSDKGL